MAPREKNAFRPNFNTMYKCDNPWKKPIQLTQK